MKIRHLQAGPRFISLRTKLLVSLTLVAISLTLYTAVASYHLANERVMDISKRLSSQTTTASGEDIADAVSLLHTSSTRFIKESCIHEIASRSFISSKQRAVSTDELSMYTLEMLNPTKTNTSFDLVATYLTNGFTFETEDTAWNFNSYESCIDYLTNSGVYTPSESYVSGKWFIFRHAETGKNILTYARFVYENLTMDKVGIALFGIYEDSVKELYSDYSSKSFLMSKEEVLLTSVGTYVAGTTYPDSDILTQALHGKSGEQNSVSYHDNNGKLQIVSFYHIWQMDAYFVSPFHYYEEVRDQEMSGYVHSMVLIASIELIIAFIVAYILSRSLSQSSTSLVNFMKEIETKDPTLRFTTTSNDEILILGKKINHMLDQLQAANAQREAELKASQAMEIQLLQQQINPHLLYNTLDSVLWVLYQNRVDDATSLVTSLSEFFKLSLAKGRDIVPLSDEIRLIGHYLTLQRLARQKDITLALNIPESLMDYPINKLTLQPLVENAVIHGFSGYRDDGEIQITAKVTGKTLLLTITDNGIGMMEDEIEEVTAALKLYPKPENFSHFGLYNINRRIIQTYGEQYGVQIESELSAYTTITISLPYSDTAEPQSRSKYL